MVVGAPGLELRDPIAAVAHLVRVVGPVAAVVRIHLGAQLGAAQGPVRLGWHVAGLDVVLVERHGPAVLGVVLPAEARGQVAVVEGRRAASADAVEVDAGVEP